MGSSHRIGGRRHRRIAAGVAVAIAVTAAAALPASAHPGFGAAAAFGFAPNTSGGTGAVGATLPYVPGSTPTLHMRVPFEQTEPFNGSDDTTVDVSVIVPAGWTNPQCVAVKTQINDVSTNSTNQPGTEVPSWTCEVVQVDSHDVLHWQGPQVVDPQTALDSAQWFVFTVTTPSPTVRTSYNGALGSGTEGFIVDQVYASGETEHWIPNAAFVGTPPVGSITTVAGGLTRTVDAAAQDIVVHWTAEEDARIQQLMAFYDMDYNEVTKFGVYVLAFIHLALDPSPLPTPVVLAPAGTDQTQTITWQPTETAILDAVRWRWALTAEDAHRFGYLVLSYIAAVQGA